MMARRPVLLLLVAIGVIAILAPASRSQESTGQVKGADLELLSMVREIADDPDLAKIVSVWPGLPEHIEAAIGALVESHKGNE